MMLQREWTEVLFKLEDFIVIAISAQGTVTESG